MKVSVVYAMMQDADAEEVLSTFPSVTAAFAYGSGAVEQGGYNYSDEKGGAELPMLDMVFAVEDPVQWHEENMRQNPGYLSLFLSFSFYSLRHHRRLIAIFSSRRSLHYDDTYDGFVCSLCSAAMGCTNVVQCNDTHEEYTFPE